jgi:DNA-binding FadR family transcriptional regulator
MLASNISVRNLTSRMHLKIAQGIGPIGGAFMRSGASAPAAQPKIATAAAAYSEADYNDVAGRRSVCIARRIEKDLHVYSWPFGTVYGSEGELRRQYRAGENSLHEALRILEFNGVGRMRRGPGGGLLIDRPPLSLVIASITGYLRVTSMGVNSDVTFENITAARVSLAEIAARLACEYAEEDAAFVAGLQNLFLHTPSTDPVIALAEAVDSACLRLAANCLHYLGRVLAVKEGVAALPVTADDSAPRRLTAAILAGQSAVAGQCARDFVLAHPVDWFVESPAVPDPFFSSDSPLNRSRVGQLVRTIARDMRTSVFAKSSYLGSETSLSERYDVARATVRQALHVLEDAGIVEARRGRGNGWFVSAPTSELPIRQIRNYLASHQLSHAHAKQVVASWRRAEGESATNPVLDLLLEGIESYADGPHLDRTKSG